MNNKTNKIYRRCPEHIHVLKINEKRFDILTNESFLVDCDTTTLIVNKKDDFIFAGKIFNPVVDCIESAHDTRLNNVTK